MEVFKAASKVYTAVTFPLYYPFTRDSSVKKTAGKQKAKRNGDTWTRIDDEYHNDVIPAHESIAHMTQDYCSKEQDKEAIGYRKILKKEKTDGRVKVFLAPEFTWLNRRQFDDRINKIMAGLISVGVKPKNIVSLFMETRIEWLLVAQALFRMNATIATLYATLGEEGIIHGMNEVESTHVITSNDLLGKVRKLKPQLPILRTIVVIRDTVNDVPEELTIDKIEGCCIVLLEEIEGADHSKSRSSGSPQSLPSPDDTALIMYTSGSTGIPKGVVLKHVNMIANIRNLGVTFARIGFSSTSRHLSYLPLAHIFELQATHIFLGLGLTVGFGSPNTLLSSSPGLMEGCMADVVLLKPEILGAVPLMLDRIRKTVEAQFIKKGGFAKSILDYALEYKACWNQSGYQTPIIDRLLVKKIRKMFGGKLKSICSGGAMLSPDTQVFAKSTLGVSLLVAFAATETGGAGAIMDYDDEEIGTVGPPQYGSVIRLEDWDEGGYHLTDEPNARGEILIKCKSVAPCYYKRPEQTEESFFLDIDGSNWFRTGDIGEMTAEGSLKIIDRKKDLIKLQFGEYISPARIEAELKCCSIVDNIGVIANGHHNYCVAIVVPSLPALQQLVGQENSGLKELCNDERVNEAALQEIKRFSSKTSLMRHEVPHKIKLVSDPWTPDSGLVTAAFKTRRKQISDFYKDVIEKLYL